MQNTEVHPLPMFYTEDAQLLMLGSFPPPRSRWKMNFFYPNFQNDMWRILGLVFLDDPQAFLATDRKSFQEEKIRNFVRQQRIAIWDVAMEIRRLQGNASDKYLDIIKTIDLAQVLSQLPQCHTITVTGQKALDTLLSLLNCPAPKTGGYVETCYLGRPLRLYRMPSSSRAYPLALAEKAKAYRQMFEEIGLLHTKACSSS